MELELVRDQKLHISRVWILRKQIGEGFCVEWIKEKLSTDKS